MANTKRRVLNRNGEMLIPMNVEGGNWDQSFISPTKIAALIVLLFLNIFMHMRIQESNTNFLVATLVYTILVIITQWVVRYVVLEEKYYYKMYKKMKQHEITTPAIFWDIVNTKDTDEGSIMVYSDMKIGIIIRIDRDTTTGKGNDFEEYHYDALSDFYKEIHQKGYKYVQMNIMEQAGKDVRLQELDELSENAENKNIRALTELQIGYIKNITRATLFESDYILLYTEDTNRIENIIPDAIECIYKLFDGAFIGFQILSLKDVIELNKEIYGVKYFDYTEATLNMFRSKGINIGKSFSIKEIKFVSGDTENVGNVEINRLNALASYISKGDIKYGDWAIRQALKGKLKSTVNSDKKTEIITKENNGHKNKAEADEFIDLDNDIFGVDTDNDEHIGENNVGEKINKNKGEQLGKLTSSCREKIHQNENKTDDEISYSNAEDEIIDF